ncbi:MAG TPA: AMP-binding protein [Candidatus Omnitrophota bacterium]|nr:AMP-binding protein [Candidatus Omnitrophota bacterium]
MIPLETYSNLEFDHPKKIKQIQNILLSEHLRYCQKNSPYYRREFKKNRVQIKKISLDNLTDLKFTDKNQIERYNDDFLAVKPKKVCDIVLSSGTCGQPTKISYSEWDLKRLAYNEKQSFAACGFTDQDTVLLTCTLDRCFVAGIAYYSGIRALGAAAVRNGLNSLASHLELIKRLKPTAIVGVPSFIRKLGLYLDQNGYPAGQSGIRKIVCIGEPLRDRDLRFLPVGQDLERIWKASAYSTYSSSEIVTTFCECTAQAGGHLHPDLAVVEIVDAGGRNLPCGTAGEVVVTPLRIEAMPLVRFKTGDISFLIEQPCSCGRKSLRLGPILGRKKQMMKVQGTTFYPQAIYACLEQIKGISEYYISVSSAGALSDNIEVHVSVNQASCTKAVIQEKLQARLRVKPKVFISDEELIKEQVYSPGSRKPVRFIDRR